MSTGRGPRRTARRTTWTGRSTSTRIPRRSFAPGSSTKWTTASISTSGGRTPFSNSCRRPSAKPASSSSWLRMDRRSRRTTTSSFSSCSRATARSFACRKTACSRPARPPRHGRPFAAVSNEARSAPFCGPSTASYEVDSAEHPNRTDPPQCQPAPERHGGRPRAALARRSRRPAGRPGGDLRGRGRPLDRFPPAPGHPAAALQLRPRLAAGRHPGLLPRRRVFLERAADRVVLRHADRLLARPCSRPLPTVFRGQPDGLAGLLLPGHLVLQAGSRMGARGRILRRGGCDGRDRACGLPPAQPPLRGGSLMAAAITFERVSKRFRVYKQRHDSLKEAFIRRRRGVYDEFWILRDLSFEVEPGTTLGIIGANGSGKSTALKLIARILHPNGGRIAVNGRV